MAYKNLSEFIEELESAGELRRIGVEVDSELEITEIAERVMKSAGGGAALLFENVKGSQQPLLINALGSKTRMCRALGVGDFDEIAARLRSILQAEIPTALLAKVKKIPQLVRMAAYGPKMVKNGACQEIVYKGDVASLDMLPILKCWPMDGGPYITFAGVYTKDAGSGARNVGMYRLQKLDGRHCA